MIDLKPAIIQWLEYPHVQGLIYFENEVYTHAELHQWVKKASHYLWALGVVPGDRILLCGKRDVIQVIFMLACHCLRASYVPVRPNSTQQEIDKIRDVTGAKYTFSDKSQTASAIHYPSWENLAHEPEYCNSIEVQPNDEAYIIFTSGTTDKPKAVAVSQHQLAIVLHATSTHIVINNTDTLSAIHNFAFDFSVWELWYALIHGASLYIASTKELGNLEVLLKNLNDRKVTLLSVTPSVFYNLGLLQQMNEHAFTYLRHIVLGGETLYPSHWNPWEQLIPRLQLHNLYGATETTIHATYIRIQPAQWSKHSPIGVPLSSYHIKVVNPSLKDVAPYHAGEMLITGPAVIKHYLHHAHTDRFICLNDKTYYKTGDYVSYDDEGCLYFHHRNPDHAKIRGHRVDVPFIRQQLETLDSIEGAQVEVCAIHGEDTLVALIKTRYTYWDTCARLQNFTVLATLPNGLKIVENNPAETQYLFQEIFVEHVYWHDKVYLPESPVIVDVGANIGLFAIYMKVMYPQALIHCFEPVPATYEKLCFNAQLYGPNIATYPAALGEFSEEIEITAYKDMSMMSGRTIDFDENLDWLVKHAQNVYANELKSISEDELQEALATKLVQERLLVKQINLSLFFKNESLQQVDLLKIDVESAEFEVLLGLQPHDWLIINHIVVEVNCNRVCVHDCMALLQQMGFQVSKVQSPEMRALNLAYLWGWRERKDPEMRKLTARDLRRYSSVDYMETLRNELLKTLPHYAIPAHFLICHSFPTNSSGKITFAPALQKAGLEDDCSRSIREEATPSYQEPFSLRQQIHQVFLQTLGFPCPPDSTIQRANTQATFFDLGANSLLMIKFYHQLKQALPECSHLRLVDLFSYPSSSQLANWLSDQLQTGITSHEGKDQPQDKIAIIGMSGIFPQSPDHETVWQHLCEGKCVIQDHSQDFLHQWAVPEQKINHPRFVSASGLLENTFDFDAECFHYSKQDAIYLNPHHRIALQQTWQAFLDAGYSPVQGTQKTGVFIGSGRNQYEHLLLNTDAVDAIQDDFLLEILNEKDYLATRLAYHFGFTGPCININNACATSAAALITACDQLRLGHCDIAVAGGIYIKLPQECGYISKEHSPFSPSGKCSPFSLQGDGLVPGSGGGLFILKSLKRAIEDGDAIKAVISGYALNNDGGDRVGFTALSLSGQIDCMQEALRHADLSTQDIDFIETHGTATPMGDALEMQALKTVYGNRKERPVYLGASKANYGHTDAASGALSLIKVIHMLQNNQIPPQIHHDGSGNHDFCQLNTTLIQPVQPLQHCAVNNFGLGGTHCQIILSRYEPVKPKIERMPGSFNVLCIAAHSQNALLRYANAFLNQLNHCSPLSFDDWYQITWQSRRNHLDLAYKAAIIGDCCLNAITQLQRLVQQKQTGLYACDNAPETLIACAQQWLDDKPVDWESLEKTCCLRRALPPYPFATTAFHYQQLVPAQIKEGPQTLGSLLLNIVRQLTQHPALEPQDNYFAAGLDSLHILDLITQAKDQLGYVFTLDDCYANPSVEALSSYGLSAPDQTKMQVKHHKATGKIVSLRMEKHTETNPMQIVFIPPASGMLFCYHELLPHLSGNAFGIQFDNSDPGQDYNSIMEFALHYSDLVLQALPKHPTVIVGWSLGGNIAYEMMLLLKTLHYPVHGLVMLDSFARYELQQNEDAYHRRYLQHHAFPSPISWHCIWKRSHVLANHQHTRSLETIPTLLLRAQHILPEYETMASIDNQWELLVPKTNLTVIDLPVDHMSILDKNNCQSVANMLRSFSNLSLSGK